MANFKTPNKLSFSSRNMCTIFFLASFDTKHHTSVILIRLFLKFDQNFSYYSAAAPQILLNIFFLNTKKAQFYVYQCF